jgi:DNA-binding response OmpR family regulator
MARVLLLEADHILASNYCQFLASLGHEVIWEQEAQNAIEITDSLAPDVIIADLFLADRSGIEFLYELRSYPDWQSLPVIVFSNIKAQEVTACLKAFEYLNIAAYHYKATTSLSKLSKSLTNVLQQQSAIA